MFSRIQSLLESVCFWVGGEMASSAQCLERFSKQPLTIRTNFVSCFFFWEKKKRKETKRPRTPARSALNGAWHAYVFLNVNEFRLKRKKKEKKEQFRLWATCPQTGERTPPVLLRPSSDESMRSYKYIEWAIHCREQSDTKIHKCGKITSNDFCVNHCKHRSQSEVHFRKL